MTRPDIEAIEKRNEVRIAAWSEGRFPALVREPLDDVTALLAYVKELEEKISPEET